MRFLFRWAFRLFLIVVVLVVGLVLVKDKIFKSLTERRIRSQTGLEVRLGNMEVGLLSPTVTIENLKLYNTAEFGGSPLLDIPELHLECDTAALPARKLRFKLVRLNLSEFNVVESRDGRTNVAGLTSRIEKLSSTNEQHKVTPRIVFSGIDVLNLTLGKVRYTSLKNPTRNAEVTLGLQNEIVTNIQSFAELSELTLNILLNKGITFVSAPAPAVVRPPAQKPATKKKP
jgi:uncharacterized protein involved in outer membrane biogenesis